jgi:hypothetical protein
MPSKLSVYNGALLALGQRKLSSLSENTVSRRRLDSVYDDDGVKACLEMGLWNFALNAIELTYSPSVEPDFGLKYAFDKPDDWVRTALVSQGGCFREQMLRYEDEGRYWYSDLDTIYVKYVSSSTSWGMDFAKWPASFTTFVEHYFAWKIAKATTNSDEDAESMERKWKRFLIQAKAKDAMNEATRFAPRGKWARARSGRYTNRENG